jgi:hypothetical protein
MCWRQKAEELATQLALFIWTAYQLHNLHPELVVPGNEQLSRNAPEVILKGRNPIKFMNR